MCHHHVVEYSETFVSVPITTPELSENTLGGSGYVVGCLVHRVLGKMAHP